MQPINPRVVPQMINIFTENNDNNENNETNENSDRTENYLAYYSSYVASLRKIIISQYRLNRFCDLFK